MGILIHISWGKPQLSSLGNIAKSRFLTNENVLILIAILPSRKSEPI